MKRIIITVILFACFLGLQAQTVEYKVDAYYVSHTTDTLDLVEPYDSIQYDTTFTYTLNYIEISDDGKDTTITKKGGRTNAEVIAELESYTEQAFNDAARLQKQAFDRLGDRTLFLSALNDVGLNEYYANVRTRIRKEMNGNWLVRSNGTLYNCTISNNNGVLRTNGNDNSGVPENTLIARLVPRSNLYMVINFQPGFGTDTDVVSTDWSNFISLTENVRLKYKK
jgi:hypothetical protein